MYRRCHKSWCYNGAIKRKNADGKEILEKASKLRKLLENIM